MATVNFINSPKSQSRAGMVAVMKYTSQDRKTVFEGAKLVSGFNCSPQSDYNEFINTRVHFNPLKIVLKYWKGQEKLDKKLSI